MFISEYVVVFILWRLGRNTNPLKVNVHCFSVQGGEIKLKLTFYANQFHIQKIYSLYFFKWFETGSQFLYSDDEKHILLCDTNTCFSQFPAWRVFLYKNKNISMSSLKTLKTRFGFFSGVKCAPWRINVYNPACNTASNKLFCCFFGCFTRNCELAFSEFMK